MTHLSLTDAARRAAVHGTLAAADVRTTVLDAAERRVALAVGDGERGSQTAEYALVGGVGAAAAAALILLLRNTNVLASVVEGVVTALLKSIRSWF